MLLALLILLVTTDFTLNAFTAPAVVFFRILQFPILTFLFQSREVQSDRRAHQKERQQLKEEVYKKALHVWLRGPCGSPRGACGTKGVCKALW